MAQPLYVLLADRHSPQIRLLPLCRIPAKQVSCEFSKANIVCWWFGWNSRAWFSSCPPTWGVVILPT